MVLKIYYDDFNDVIASTPPSLVVSLTPFVPARARSSRSWSVLSASARARARSWTLLPRALVLPANEYREHPSPEIYLPPLCVTSSRMLAPLVPCHVLPRALVHTPSASLHSFRERDLRALVVLKINHADFNYVTALAPPRLWSHSPRSCQLVPLVVCPVHERSRSTTISPRAHSRCPLMITASTRPPTMHPVPLCAPRPHTLAPLVLPIIPARALACAPSSLPARALVVPVHI